MKCRINVSCKKFSQKKTHTLLHIYTTNQTSMEVINNNVPDIYVYNSTQCHSCMQNYNVLLSTAFINVKSSTGNVVQCRAFIDNASQFFFSKNCVEWLNLSFHSKNHRLLEINGIYAETFLISLNLFYQHILKIITIL